MEKWVYDIGPTAPSDSSGSPDSATDSSDGTGLSGEVDSSDGSGVSISDGSGAIGGVTEDADPSSSTAGSADISGDTDGSEGPTSDDSSDQT